MTLAEHLDAAVCKALWLESLAGDMLATIKLNVERGNLVAVNEEGKRNLAQLIAGWERKLTEIEEYRKGC